VRHRLGQREGATVASATSGFTRRSHRRTAIATLASGIFVFIDNKVVVAHDAVDRAARCAFGCDIVGVSTRAPTASAPVTTATTVTAGTAVLRAVVPGAVAVRGITAASARATEGAGSADTTGSTGATDTADQRVVLN